MGNGMGQPSTVILYRFSLFFVPAGSAPEVIGCLKNVVKKAAAPMDYVTAFSETCMC
jgi:hypothetical protein